VVVPGARWGAHVTPGYAGWLAGPSKLQQPPGLAYQYRTQSQAASTSSLPANPKSAAEREQNVQQMPRLGISNAESVA